MTVMYILLVHVFSFIVTFWQVLTDWNRAF